MTPEEMRDKYLASMAATSTQTAYKTGIQNTTVNPMEEAAKADELYLRRVTEAVQSGRRRAALLAVPVTRWKTNATGEGANRLAGGAKKATDKVLAHFRLFKPVYDQISAECKSMPKGGVDEALAKVRVSIESQMRAAGKL